MSNTTNDSTLKTLVIVKIKDLIKENDLKPGDRLPTERKLAETLGVSRTVVRDAIQTLVGYGILYVRERVGLFVSEVDSENIAIQLSHLLIPNHYTAKNLFDVRLVIETAIAGWAANNNDSEKVEKLGSIISEMKEDAKHSEVVFRQHDRDFHITIAEISNNSIVLELMKSLLVYFEVFSRYTFKIPNRIISSANEHEVIYNAIKSGDAEKAEEAMNKHVRSVYNSILESLGKEENKDRILESFIKNSLSIN